MQQNATCGFNFKAKAQGLLRDGKLPRLFDEALEASILRGPNYVTLCDMKCSVLEISK